MTPQHLSAEQIEDMLARRSELRLEITFEGQGSRSQAQIQIIDKRAKQRPAVTPEQEIAQAIAFRLLTAISACGAVASIITGAPGMWGMTLLATIAALFFTLRSSRRRRIKRSVREIEGITALPFSAEIWTTWAHAAQEDSETYYLVKQWLVNKRSIRLLSDRIDEGVLAQKKLSTSDPLRQRMQVEIETLRSRRNDARTSLRLDEELIEATAQSNSDNRQQRLDVERKRAADEAAEKQGAKEFEQRMRSVGDEEQSRLKAQEHAQDWLYGQAE